MADDEHWEGANQGGDAIQAAECEIAADDAPVNDRSDYCEVLTAGDIYTSLPSCLQDLLHKHGLTLGNRALLRATLSDITQEDTIQLLAEAEADESIDAVDVHHQLMALAPLLVETGASARSKRLRTDYFRVPLVLTPALAEESDSPPADAGSHKLPRIRPVPTMSVWAGRAASRIKAAKHTTDPNMRASREEEERLRQAKTIVAFLKEGNAPSVQQAMATMRPERALLALVGNARATSMRKHGRACSRVRFWTKLNYGMALPTAASHLVDYLWALYDDQCKRTQPDTAVTAVNFMEEKAGIEDERRIGRMDLVTNTLRYLNSLLAKGAPEVRKAPMVLISIAASLEYYIMDRDKPLYARGLAWLVLVLIWTAMRFDDSRALLPSRLRLLAFSME